MSVLQDDDLARILGEPSESEKAEQKAKSDAFLRSILSGDIDFGAGPYVLRSIVENDTWFVPIKEDGRFELINVSKGEYQRAIWGVSKTDGRRTVREGKGGQFLPVYMDEPAGVSTRRFDGRSLARSLPENVNGLLIHEKHDDKEHPRELCKEFFETLRSLADAVDIEEVLLTPGPIDTTRLKQYKWLVDKVDDKYLHLFPMVEGDLAAAFTHRDLESGTEHRPAEEMDGETFFRMVVNEPEFDGLVINPHQKFGRQGMSVQNLVLSPSFLHRALEEKSCHLRVLSLVVRSVEEFEAWLYLNDFPAERELVEETNDVGQKAIYAKSKNSSEKWRLQETVGMQDPEYARTPSFILKPSPDSKPGFGRGPSTILCPGLLARELFIAPKKGTDPSKAWSPGRSMIAGKMLDKDDIRKSHHRLELASELLKLVPRNSNQIPRSAILSVVGADFLRRVPYCGTKDWIEKSLKQAERYTQKWVWGG